MMHHFDIDIAKHIGMPAAVMFSNIYHWILHNETNGKHNHDGKFWTFNSMAAFQKQMPYLSERSIRTALTKLIDAKYIITGNYNSSPMDRTIWYALGEVGEAFKSRDLQGEFPICQNEQMHLTKMTNATDQNDEPIPVINTDINNNSIGTPVPTGNNNVYDISMSSGILQRAHVHAQEGGSSSTGNSLTRTHACAQEQQEKKIQTIRFDYDGSWRFVGITDRHIAYWQEHHPNVDVKGELTRMEMWLITHREQRKKRIEAFINSWLSRAEQDRRNNNGENGYSTTNLTAKTGRNNPEDFATKHIIPTSEQYDEAIRRDPFFQSGIIPF